MRKFKMSLVAIDIAPVFQDTELITAVTVNQAYEFTAPKTKNSTYYHSNIMLKPEDVDFKAATPEPVPEAAAAQAEKEIVERLAKANGRKLGECERRCYDLLVRVEKEINWNTLLKIKSAAFLIETEDSQWENPHLRAEMSRPSDTKSHTPGVSEESFLAIKKSASLFLKEKAEMRRGVDEELEKIEENKDENNVSDYSGPEKPRNRRKTNLESVTVEEKQVTFASGASGEEDEGESEGEDIDRGKGDT